MADFESNEGILVGIPEIAQIAGVGRSAVGNWRKRHSDFPIARVQTPSGVLFDLGEVETWLVEAGKIERRVSPSTRLWALADSTRGTWDISQLVSFLVAGLVYLEACARAAGQPTAYPTPVIATRATWAKLRALDESEFPQELVNAAHAIENENPDLDGLLTPGLSLAGGAPAGVARGMMLGLDAAVDELTPPFAVYEEALARLFSADRFAGEHSTPDDVVHLVTQLLDVSGGTMLDPAVGEGGLLMMAAIGEARDPERAVRLIGVERYTETARLARSRFYLYDIPADIRCADSLSLDPDDLPLADGILIDPPYGVKGWGDADLYLDERWTFGPPPPNCGDFAWIELAANQLQPMGRAAVILPAGSLFRGGREASIRHALVDAYAIEAVVALPARLRTDTSIPLAVWLLRSPRRGDPEDLDILFVDASGLAEPGRSRHSLPEAAIDEIVSVVRSWRSERVVPSRYAELAWIAVAEHVANNDFVLEPSRYRPRPEIDITGVEVAAAAATERLKASVAAMDTATRDLLDLLEVGE